MSHLLLPQVIPTINLDLCTFKRLFLVLIKYILVTFKNVEDIPFPAITVCAPSSIKWTALIEALNLLDDGEHIKNLILDYDDESSNSIISHLESIFVNQISVNLKLSPKLKVDHDFPDRLGLLSIEKDVFYLIHYACYSLGSECSNRLIVPLPKESLKLAINGKSREETAKEIINNALNTARYIPIVPTLTVGSVSFSRNPTTLSVRVLKFIVEKDQYKQ